jgi:hypothetical protein
VKRVASSELRALLSAASARLDGCRYFSGKGRA